MILKEFKVFSNDNVIKQYKFNENGLNIILGDKKDPNDDSNGSGKTTLIECIRFILGGSIDSYYSENSTLIDKCISVALVVKTDKEYMLLRKFSNPNKGYVCQGSIYSIDYCEEKESDDYKEFINRMILGKEYSSEISLQNINEYIIRDEQNGFLKDRLGIADRKEQAASKVFSFVSNLPFDAETKIKEYTKKISELKKQQLAYKSIKKRKISELKSAKKSLNKQILEIERQLQEINVVKQYKVDTSFYKKVKEELNDSQRELFKKEHIINQYQKNIDNLEKKNEEIKALNELESFYTELIDLFPEKVKKNQQVVEKFHSFMLENRGAYYKNKIANLSDEIGNLNNRIKILQNEVDSISENLRETTIIGDINSILKNKDNLVIQLGNIETEIESYSIIKNLQRDILREESGRLKLVEEKLDEFNASENNKIYAEKLFNQFVEKTYPDAQSNLTIDIETDTRGGKNSTAGRITYDCSLSYSRSQGISHMKNNIFDLSLFFTNLKYSNKPLGYLFHDGSYSKNDENAKERLLDDVNSRLIRGKNGQYFITVNKNELSSKSIIKYIEKGIVTVKLDRNKDENRLFGFKFDDEILNS